ncbi:MAG: ABC transporter substrate-binding protein [Acidaminococcales bacterium]|jgi:ABC-type nitrate/sulfonate/bicarbonate transport system substrate-binding protein|nr:ABC transporter substrate-binding protein [Acidaminococcales bacterium]
MAVGKGKILAGILGIIVVGGIIYGANFASKPVSGSEGEKDAAVDEKLFPIKTWSRTNCEATPWVIADKKGFLKEEGLRIVYTGDTQANQRIPSVLNGDNDVGTSHPNGIAVAIAGGAKIKGTYPLGIDPTPDLDPKLRHMNWYVNPKEHPDIKTFKDLLKLDGKLKFVTSTRNTCTDFLTNKIADASGVPRNKIEFVTMPDVQTVQALKQGLITVGAVHPPYYKSMENAGMVKIADSLDAKIGAAGGIGFYYFNTDFINKNRDVIKRFGRAMIKAQKYANEHPEEAQKLTEEWIKVPVSATHYYGGRVEFDDKDVEPWLEDLRQNKVIPQDFKVSDVAEHIFQ